ncbi:MAG: crotonase/enoyl-CoA hydratase family protein [Rhodocyclaceae bacterium]|nr:crotonase/enoyl-CoA hydratase family protein [Rhodocyclaceae bacterium]
MTVKIEKNGAVTTVIINRPEVRNAIDQATAQALVEAFEAFDADDEAHVAVLCGEGGYFCAGADLKSLSSGPEKWQLKATGNGPLGPTRHLLSKPVIAAVSGHAVAGGLELALWADLRVAEQSAVFGVFCRRWGVPLIDGGTVRLARLIGHSRALDMILTGRAVSAEEALSFGLANRVVADGTGRAAAEKLAAQIAAFPQLCMRHDRLSSYEQWGMNLPDAILNEYGHGMQTLASGETLKGASRFASGEGRHGSFE